MLEYSNSMADNVQYRNIAWNAVQEMAEDVFGIDAAHGETLYVLSAHNNRRAEIYLSPEIPRVADLADSLSDEIPLSIEIGGDFTPQRDRWLAIRRDIHVNNPQQAAAVTLIVWAHINNLITY